MSALILRFDSPRPPAQRADPQPPPVAQQRQVMDPPADVRRVAEDLRDRYVAAFDTFLKAALQYSSLDKGSDDLKKHMNYAQSAAAGILDRIRIESRLANYERRGMTACKDYERQRHFRRQEVAFIERRASEVRPGWERENGNGGA